MFGNTNRIANVANFQDFFRISRFLTFQKNCDTYVIYLQVCFYFHSEHKFNTWLHQLCSQSVRLGTNRFWRQTIVTQSHKPEAGTVVTVGKPSSMGTSFYLIIHICTSPHTLAQSLALRSQTQTRKKHTKQTTSTTDPNLTVSGRYSVNQSESGRVREGDKCQSWSN